MRVLLHQPTHQRWLLFREPVAVVEAYAVEQVPGAIAQLETQVNQTGLYAAGFLSYEASPAFDVALTVQSPDAQLPLLWFGLFSQPQELTDAELALREWQAPGQEGYQLEAWQPSVSPTEFEQAIAQIKQAIAQGETFQVNYTFRLRTQFQGNPWALFQDLMQAQPGNYAAFIETGRHVVCSASPELFFRRQGDRLITRPMKGTAERGQGHEGDRLQAQTLQTSVKNRAENLMIVDMLRNDLGRIAKLGTVQVPSLFDVEQYPTLWQMTSTVTAQTNASMGEVFRALFPCASITGAPKASTMGIIRSLECSPRRVYTGAIGYWGLDSQLQIQAQFNVAIRTVLLDLATGLAEYGVGSGIVWDSDSSAEYEECVLKTAILGTPGERTPGGRTAVRPDGADAFDLLETLLWEPGQGYFLLDLHLQRMARSAADLGFEFDLAGMKRQLWALSQTLAQGGDRPEGAIAYRVRVLSDRQGKLQIQHFPWDFTPSPEPLRVKLAPQCLDSATPLLYHKTTQRQIYEAAKTSCLDCDDVLLWNQRGEVTESCIANIVVPWQGKLLTPPVSSGLLPGTFRAWLLAQGEIEEAGVAIAQLRQVPEFFLINSLRRWQRARLVE